MSALLEARGVAKAFGGVKALDGVDLTLDAPLIYGLIGPNGAGKTTFFDVLCGRQTADSGEIRVEGARIDGTPSHARARRGFARTFQECRVLPEESCLDNVLFAAQEKRLAHAWRQLLTRDRAAREGRVEEAMRLLRLVRLDGFAHRPASALSYGQRRLLEIVSTLIARPRFLLLDEPASGVNPTLLNTLHDFLLEMHAERPIVFLVVEHNMPFVMSVASRIVVMHQGRVLTVGAPEQVRGDKAVIEAYLG